MVKKRKNNVLIANFDRLEKLLFFHLLENKEDFEVVGIVSDHKPKEIAYFLSYDTNHGKFLPGRITSQDTQNKRGISLHFDKKVFIKVFDKKTASLSELKKLKADIVVDLSKAIKLSQLSRCAKLTSDYVLALDNSDLKKKLNFQKGVFHFNHNSFNEKEKIILLPGIETTIISIFIRSLKNKWEIDACFFDLIYGTNNQFFVLDTVPSEKQFFFNRSAINNLITYEADRISKSVTSLLSLLDLSMPVKGQITHTPTTTGCLLNLKFYVKKVFKVHEVNDYLKQEVDAQIGFSNESLVSQDIVSTEHYGVIDGTLTWILESKNYQIVNLGIWFDFESSLVISCFKTLMFLSGVKIRN